MQNEIGRANIMRNQNFISISSISYIDVIHDLEVWHPVDIDDGVLGVDILRACQKTHDYAIEYQRRKNAIPTNYNEWVKKTKEKFNYRTDRIMFKDIEKCCLERHCDKFIIIPLVHMKLKAWGRRNSDEIEDIVLDVASTPIEIGKRVKSVLDINWGFNGANIAKT